MMYTPHKLVSKSKSTSNNMILSISILVGIVVLLFIMTKYFGKYIFQWKENVKLSIRTYLHDKIFKRENGETVYIAPDSITNHLWEFLDTYILAPSDEYDSDMDDYDYSDSESDSDSESEADIRDYMNSTLHDDNQIQTILEGFKKKKKRPKKEDENADEKEDENADAKDDNADAKEDPIDDE